MADAGNLDLEICHMSIDRVGPGLPCTLPFSQKSAMSQAIQYSKSVDTKEYNDIVKMDLGITMLSDCNVILIMINVINTFRIQLSSQSKFGWVQ